LGGECQKISHLHLVQITFTKQIKQPGLLHAVTTAARLGCYCPKLNQKGKKREEEKNLLGPMTEIQPFQLGCSKQVGTIATSNRDL